MDPQAFVVTSTAYPIERYPEHSPDGCEQCDWLLTEYGRVVYNRVNKHHRGWHEGMKTKEYHQLIEMGDDDADS